MFQDDPNLVYGTDAQVNSTLDALGALGVDRIRVSVFWKIVAPANDQKVRPVFDATDPAAYPQNLWAPYDRIVTAAAGARHRRELQRHLAGAALGRDRDARRPHRPAGHVRAQHRRVRTVRQGARHALQRRPTRACRASTTGRSGTSPTRPAGSRRSGARTRATPSSSSRRRRRSTATSSPPPATDLTGIGPRRRHGPRRRDGPPGRQGLRLSRPLSPLRFLRRLYCLDDNLNLLKGEEATVRGCPADPASVRRRQPGAVPVDGLRPPSLRAARAAGAQVQVVRRRRDVRSARPQPRAQAHLRALRPEDADPPRRAAVSDGVRLPDQARPVHRVVLAAGGVHQRGRVHLLPQPERPRDEPVPARRRRADRGRRPEEGPAAVLAHVPERPEAPQRQAQARLRGVRHPDLRPDAHRAPRAHDRRLRPPARREAECGDVGARSSAAPRAARSGARCARSGRRACATTSTRRCARPAAAACACAGSTAPRCSPAAPRR